jgi:hypothetical protein
MICLFCPEREGDVFLRNLDLSQKYTQAQRCKYELIGGKS